MIEIKEVLKDKTNAMIAMFKKDTKMPNGQSWNNLNNNNKIILN